MRLSHVLHLLAARHMLPPLPYHLLCRSRVALCRCRALDFTPLTPHAMQSLLNVLLYLMVVDFHPLVAAEVAERVVLGPSTI